MIRKGLRPGFRLGFERPGSEYRFRLVLPFRRHWVAIAVVAVFDAVFLFPAITTFQQAAEGWARFDDLFDLTAALFLTGWLIGWSIAPLLLTAILALMLLGREVVRAGPGRLELFLGLPLFGLTARYDASRIRNLRREIPAPKSGKSWRGPHMAFDYGANSAEFGSHIGAAEAAGLKSRIEMATGVTIRSGTATAGELEGDWEPADSALSKLVDEESPEQQREASLAGEPSGALSRVTLASPSTLLKEPPMTIFPSA